MQPISFFSFLLFSTLLSAQQSLQEIRAEENLFIIKMIVVVVVVLIAMPFLLRKLRAFTPATPHKHIKILEEDEEDEVEKPKEEKIVEEVDPLDQALETLLREHPIVCNDKENCLMVYRHYLELTMGQLQVKTGSFDINDVFDGVMKKVHKLDENRNFEIVFDIAPDVPSKVIGDVDRMSDTLFYVLKNVVLESSDYLITLKIRRLNHGDDALHLECYIPYSFESFGNEMLDMFTPFKKGSSCGGTELYLAKKYAEMMHGEVALVSESEDGSGFIMNLTLYVTDPSELRHYRLPSKTMIEHSVLVVDDHKASAEAVQKMFEYFKNEVEVISSKELFSALDILESYDIVVIQERYFAKHLLLKLKEVKVKQEIKVVSLNKNEGFKHIDEETKTMLDAELAKPVTVQKVFDLLIALY